jgi:hypothetical protein
MGGFKAANWSKGPFWVVKPSTEYMERGEHHVTRVLFKKNIDAKLHDTQFTADIGPLLAATHKWDSDAAAATVLSRVIELLPGDPWKGERA